MGGGGGPAPPVPMGVPGAAGALTPRSALRGPTPEHGRPRHLRPRPPACLLPPHEAWPAGRPLPVRRACCPRACVCPRRRSDVEKHQALGEPHSMGQGRPICPRIWAGGRLSRWDLGRPMSTTPHQDRLPQQPKDTAAGEVGAHRCRGSRQRGPCTLGRLPALLEGFLQEAGHDLVRRVFPAGEFSRRRRGPEEEARGQGQGALGFPWGSQPYPSRTGAPASSAHTVAVLEPTSTLTLLGKGDFSGSPEAAVHLVSPLSALGPRRPQPPFLRRLHREEWPVSSEPVSAFL